MNGRRASYPMPMGLPNTYYEMTRIGHAIRENESRLSGLHARHRQCTDPTKHNAHCIKYRPASFRLMPGLENTAPVQAPSAPAPPHAKPSGPETTSIRPRCGCPARPQPTLACPLKGPGAGRPAQDSFFSIPPRLCKPEASFVGGHHLHSQPRRVQYAAPSRLLMWSYK